MQLNIFHNRFFSLFNSEDDFRGRIRNCRIQYLKILIQELLHEDFCERIVCISSKFKGKEKSSCNYSLIPNQSPIPTENPASSLLVLLT